MRSYYTYFLTDPVVTQLGLGHNLWTFIQYFNPFGVFDCAEVELWSFFLLSSLPGGLLAQR